jgi:translation elongation factor EF-Tu-like GTPase
MGLFRRKAEIVDAEHLLQEAPTGTPAASRTPGTDASASADFRLTVQEVFSIRGRGTVVTGTVESGAVSVGAAVAQTRGGLPVRIVRVSGVEMFRKKQDRAVAGDTVGLLLDAVDRGDVTSGDVLTAAPA